MIKWLNGVQTRTPTPGQPVPMKLSMLIQQTASDPEPEVKPEEKTEIKEDEDNG